MLDIHPIFHVLMSRTSIDLVNSCITNDDEQAIPDIEDRHRRLVELNVQESCMNLFANPIVQKKQAQGGMPKIHGWVYDVGTGLLKRLDIDFKVRARICLSLFVSAHLCLRTRVRFAFCSRRVLCCVGFAP